MADETSALLIMQIHLLRADRTSLKVDALVYPAETQSGGAVVTSSGNFLCRFVIHVPVPEPGDGDEDAKLRAATTDALERAEELAIASVGLPLLGKGDLERCARVMIGAAIDFRTRARSLQRALFCLFGQEEFDAFERALKELDG
ncbi:MAG TPA: macro domain-containing protein [Thermoanaerobaculia bacterium]|nr:macro domain-containing protein [Thermoanaerobaculia bacterium]